MRYWSEHSEHMWGRMPWEHGWMMGAHPHGWAWMHGRSGGGFQHHAAMMDGSGHGWWIPGEALMLAMTAVLVIGAIVVAAILIVRHRPAAPHPG